MSSKKLMGISGGMGDPPRRVKGEEGAARGQHKTQPASGKGSKNLGETIDTVDAQGALGSKFGTKGAHITLAKVSRRDGHRTPRVSAA